MLRRHQASLDDRKKFTALVKDLFPDQAKNVNLLLMAYNMGIAQDIQNASHINNTFAFRYVKQLMDDFGMSRVKQTGLYQCGVPAMEEKFLEKPVTFLFRSREADRQFRENSHLRVNLMGNFLPMRKAAGEKVLQ